MTVRFQLLGTGAGPGVPSFYCDCIACLEAKEKPHLARTRSGAVLDIGHERLLIDASPDLRSQLIKERIKSLDYLFITHWHYDHFGGIGDLEFYIKLSRKRPLRLFLPPGSVEEFRSAYPFLEDVFKIETWEFERTYQFGEVKLTGLPARHSIPTAGILLEAEKRVAYFTDTSGLPESTAERIQGVDALICDSTFHGENWYPHSHMSMVEAIKLGNMVRAEHTILTHLAMHYSTPTTVAQIEAELESYPNVSLAYDGMLIEL
ncbi:MBL fold metallo-hydrolase [Desulfosporosinus shakirovi]|uniref:MBL fold metallo-hydrolase n=1 Tax=Desulfosporosinus shakirovi TaxID=2885154 RepID=UPI001E5B39EC|nr:MBL fold metallo-hydrolase [Desulfosporosinus sp. SRJS8]MCB8814824.1 MBL fold metallo-hydrolase [Desulfosporosinus sp. SRJS8]